MKPVLLFFTALVLAVQAHATAPSCLKTVSDQDLLDEVALRMGRTTPNPNESALVSFSCRFQTLTISLVEASTGNEQREEMNLTDAGACAQLESFLTSRLANKAVSKAAIVASCRFQTLQRVSLHPNGSLKRLQDQNMTDAGACNSARDRINDAL